MYRTVACQCLARGCAAQVAPALPHMYSVKAHVLYRRHQPSPRATCAARPALRPHPSMAPCMLCPHSTPPWCYPHPVPCHVMSCHGAIHILFHVLASCASLPCSSNAAFAHLHTLHVQLLPQCTKPQCAGAPTVQLGAPSSILRPLEGRGTGASSQHSHVGTCRASLYSNAALSTAGERVALHP